MKQFPVRLDAGLRRVLRADLGDVAELSPGSESGPRLFGTFSSAVAADVSFMLRVHSQTGIPLAFGVVTVPRGAETFESTALTFIGMEGYAHLSRQAARTIEERVWTRRAFATAVCVTPGSARD